jgi:putative ABC transport system permease protein
VLVAESARLAVGSIRVQPLRSTLAVAGVVIGIVTVTLVTSVLAGARNQVALLFREFGSDNIFAYHRRGDPYTPPTEAEAQRRVLDPAYAEPLARLGQHVRDVAVMLIVPNVSGGKPLVARGPGTEADNILVEGVTSNYQDVVAEDLAAGRPFTEVEGRAAARVAILGANVARALFGGGRAVGRELLLGGVRFDVVGEAAPRKGAFFGENRQDNVIAIPLETARRLFPEAEATVFYIRGEPGRRDLAFAESEAILRRLRRLPPDAPNDFNLSTADQIIAQFDRISALIGLVTVALAAVSLGIGGLGIANVMIISVTERTREIGLRRGIGARRREVLRQFLLEAAILSLVGGLVGVGLAAALGALLTLAAPGLAAAPPAWAVLGGVGASFVTGLVAGFGPARRAAALDPVEALRYE